MRLAFVAVVSTLAAGCLGSCGPTVSQVEASSVIQAEYTEANRTLLRQALVDAGFTIDTTYADTHPVAIHAVRDDQRVWVDADFLEQTTHVRITFDVPRREFSDSEAGHRRANRYVDEQATRLQPAADEVFSALAGAVEADSTPRSVEGYATIC